MKRSLGARTLAYPTPVFAVGTFDDQDRPNVMISSWAGICCSVPPCLAVSLRRATYSHSGIVRHKAFTVSIPGQDQVRQADYCGMVSGRVVDKWKKTGLTPVPSELVHAPYVKEFPVVLECRLLHTFELGLHTQFVGEILDVKAEERVLDVAGRTEIEKVQPFLFDPDTQRYFGLGACLGPAFKIGAELGQ